MPLIKEFIPGDKVQLHSGGPVMTVRGLHFDVLANQYSKNMYDCVWFQKNKEGVDEPHFCPFYADELIKPEDLS